MSEPRSLLFLTDSLSDLDGVGRYGLRLIGALEELLPGLEVRVLLARKHRPTSSEVPDHWKVEVALPPDYFYYMSPARFWVDRLRSVRRVRRAARGVDLIHSIKDFPHSLVALQAAQAEGLPCVATGHGTYTVQPLLSERHGESARRTYAELDALISVSRYTARRLVEILGEGSPVAKRLHVIPNAVRAEHYVERRALGARPWHSGPFTLSIGELKERKGHHLALEAWCRAAAGRDGWRHFVVGRGANDAYQRSLAELVARHGLSDRVHFLGNVTEEEKVDLLQRAEVFVHTPVAASDGGFEGFGIVYLEASASGTAALGTLECGAEDAIVEGRTGLLVEPEVAAVTAGLTRLLDDAELRERLGRGGREHARASSWGDNARRVLEIYREVLGRRPGRGRS